MLLIVYFSKTLILPVWIFVLFNQLIATSNVVDFPPAAYMGHTELCTNLENSIL